MALRASRVAFCVLERVAPRSGGQLAASLWCTPPRRSRRRRHDPVVPGVPGEVLAVPVDGRTVVTEAWGSGPIVYLVHGWGGWRGQLNAFVAPLVAAGHRVISFDALSHGESDPGSLGRRRSALPEMAATLAGVLGACGPAHGIVAHSLGGSAAALAICDGVPAGRLVFVGAPADPMGYTEEFALALGFGERIRADLLRRVEDFSRRPVTEFNVAVRAARAAAEPVSSDQTGLPPLLVIHDVDDKEVAYADGKAIAAAWPGAELVTTTGLGHRRILRDAAVLRRSVDFLDHGRL